MRVAVWGVLGILFAGGLALLPSCGQSCDDNGLFCGPSDCDELYASPGCADPSSEWCKSWSNELGCDSPTGAGGSGGGGAGQGGGGGGSHSCGGCASPTPICDEASGECVACASDADCGDPAKARCDEGACVPCMASKQCAGIAGAGVCADGTCVECAAGEESACGSGETCDLLANECVGVAPGSVSNCGACTNDSQCQSDHRCIPLDFQGEPHGHYCLKEASPSCTRPFSVTVTAESVSGESPTDYCGVDVDLTTCEAVLAFMNAWECSGDDGMCGPPGMPEVAVPGALCRQVGALANVCTYACSVVFQCPSGPPANSCGTGSGSPPGWCGG